MVMWQAVDAASKQWQMSRVYEGTTPVNSVAWGTCSWLLLFQRFNWGLYLCACVGLGATTGLLSATLADNSVMILHEAAMVRKVANGLSAVQTGPDRVLLERFGTRAV